MSARAYAVIIVACAVLLFQAGCVAGTWVKRTPGIANQKTQTNTLLVAYQVRSGPPDSTDDTTGVLTTMYQNQHLGEFGAVAQQKLSKAMSAKGFHFYKDQPRTARLKDWPSLRKKYFQKAAGIWVDPKTSTQSFNKPDLFGYSPTQMTSLLRTTDKQEHFASVSIYIDEGVDYPCAGVVGWSHPSVTVDVKVLSNTGREVFNARLVGRGENVFGYKSRSLDNLNVAFDNALAQMKTLKEKQL